MSTHDLTGNLSAGKLNEIKAKLEEKGAVQKCSQCSFKDMVLLDSLVALPAFSPQGLPGGTMPSAVLCCTNCGHLVLHNMGVLNIKYETE